jgi:hypothetical protein
MAVFLMDGVRYGKLKHRENMSIRHCSKWRQWRQRSKLLFHLFVFIPLFTDLYLGGVLLLSRRGLNQYAAGGLISGVQGLTKNEGVLTSQGPAAEKEAVSLRCGARCGWRWERHSAVAAASERSSRRGTPLAILGRQKVCVCVCVNSTVSCSKTTTQFSFSQCAFRGKGSICIKLERLKSCIPLLHRHCIGPE